ncbi:amino acid ABC transporter permease [Sciscionella sediminilitoris]|uniref:amino acid ABC transporter permease n=1 Tax=Sciscionella sediminilitoris TaxID=1445613 RepID=UPI0004DF9A7E|nr:amino acid ABC transporter permease [Sciscionella sp. SE31]
MNVLTDNLDVYGSALLNTVLLFVFSAIGALILGGILAIMRVSPVPVLRGFGTVFVTIVINTPLTVLFLLFLFGLPVLQIANIDPFVSAVIALIVYTAPFICEVIRSGINTVDLGQAEAARAVGLSFGQSLANIVLPQAIRSVVPPLINQLNALLKNTTVAAGFSVSELGLVYTTLNERGYNTMIALCWVALAFIILVTPLLVTQRVLEKRWRVAR